MNQNLKKNEAITLISLVITIIVLIILAGISINLILGQDGIINKAKEAKQNIEYAQIEEQEQLNTLYDQMIGESSGSTSYDAIAKLSEFKKELADYIESKNVERPETAGDASVYINSFEKVLLAEQNKLSEFKREIASTITDMGIETSENADVNTMASNIRNLSEASSSKPTKTQRVTKTVNNNWLTFTFNELTEIVGVISVSGISQGVNTTEFYIDNLSGNTIQVKTYRNLDAPFTVTVTAIGY